MKIPTKKILFFLMAVLFYGCVSPPTPPTNAVDEEKMAKILADIHLAESKVNQMNLLKYDSSQVAFKELERRILKKYGVDSAQYRNSYDFYVVNSDLMVKIYDKSVKILEEKKKKGIMD